MDFQVQKKTQKRKILKSESIFRYSGNDDGNGSFPGVGMKLLLLAEKYPWVQNEEQNIPRSFHLCFFSNVGL